MLRLKRQAIEEQIEERDLITPKDAADLSGRSLPTILGLMAIDTLPIYVLPGDKRTRPQRFTSRAEVVAFVKKQTAKKRKAK
jgi:hypothetical protein